MTRMFTRGAIAATIAVCAALAGCTSSFQERSATHFMETDGAHYYQASGSWDSTPSSTSTTIKRVDKVFGAVSYGKNATASLDNETPVARR